MQPDKLEQTTFDTLIKKCQGSKVWNGKLTWLGVWKIEKFYKFQTIFGRLWHSGLLNRDPYVIESHRFHLLANERVNRCSIDSQTSWLVSPGLVPMLWRPSWGSFRKFGCVIRKVWCVPSWSGNRMWGSWLCQRGLRGSRRAFISSLPVCVLARQTVDLKRGFVKGEMN